MNKGGCKHCPGCFSKSYWLEQTISPFPQMIEDEKRGHSPQKWPLHQLIFLFKLCHILAVAFLH